MSALRRRPPSPELGAKRTEHNAPDGAHGRRRLGVIDQRHRDRHGVAQIRGLVGQRGRLVGPSVRDVRNVVSDVAVALLSEGGSVDQQKDLSHPLTVRQPMHADRLSLLGENLELLVAEVREAQTKRYGLVFHCGQSSGARVE